ncbi:hypothetical protein BJG01_15790 [Vibrio splendidus]|nr:hypothetical protein BJG01_15790 [Vibrio splendidus]
MFARFNRSEANQLCTQYNNINLQGKSNWRLATKDELVSLYSTYSNMFAAKGWATLRYYWSSTPNGGYYYLVNLYHGTVFNDSSKPRYASCVSGS